MTGDSLYLQVLEVMWELCHSADMSRLLVDKCLDEMHDVLVASSVIKESYKRRYLDKCVDCIKKGPSISRSVCLCMSVRLSSITGSVCI